jgi:hypothetical protein
MAKRKKELETEVVVESEFQLSEDEITPVDAEPSWEEVTVEEDTKENELEAQQPVSQEFSDSDIVVFQNKSGKVLTGQYGHITRMGYTAIRKA